MKRILFLLFLASSAQAAVSYNGAATFVSTITVTGASPILSTSTLQSGTTFFVSSGSITGIFSINRPNQNMSIDLGTGSGGTGVMLVHGNSAVSSTKFRIRHQALNTGVTIGSLLFSNTNSGIEQVGINIADGNDAVTTSIGRSGAVKTSTITLTGFIQLPSKSFAEIATITPTASSQYFGCSDCAAVTTCVSTGTTVGAFALITNKTAACQ